MAPITRYARARDGVSIAYQVGDGKRDMVYVPQSYTAVEVMWEHPMGRLFTVLG